MERRTLENNKAVGFMGRVIKGWSDKGIYGGGNNKVRSKVWNKGLCNDGVRLKYCRDCCLEMVLLVLPDRRLAECKRFANGQKVTNQLFKSSPVLCN